MSSLNIGIACDGYNLTLTKNNGEQESMFINQEYPEDLVLFFNKIAPYLGIEVTQSEDY